MLKKTGLSGEYLKRHLPINFHSLIQIQALLDSFNLIHCSSCAAVVAASALERRILNLNIELNLRLCT